MNDKLIKELKIRKIQDMVDKGEIVLVAMEVITAYKVVDYKIDENIGLPVFTKLEAIAYWDEEQIMTEEESFLDIYKALFEGNEA